VEEEGGLEVVLVVEAVGHLLDGLDLRVEALRGGVSDRGGTEVVGDPLLVAKARAS
jgi:hypothetical protein